MGAACVVGSSATSHRFLFTSPLTAEAFRSTHLPLFLTITGVSPFDPAPHAAPMSRQTRSAHRFKDYTCTFLSEQKINYQVPFWFSILVRRPPLADAGVESRVVEGGAE